MTDIKADNVERLRPAWSFSTGVLHGHEGGPLVVNGIMYIHTPFPNNTFAFDLERPGEILWEHKPKQDPAARAVACCDVVNRGLAYADGKIFKTLLDGHIVALDAKTGKEIWKMENSDIRVGSTLTVAPFVVKDKVLVGSSGAELGVRGYVTAYDLDSGEMRWRWYATGPDEEMGLAPDFNGKNPHYGQKGLGLKTLRLSATGSFPTQVGICTRITCEVITRELLLRDSIEKGLSLVDYAAQSKPPKPRTTMAF